MSIGMVTNVGVAIHPHYEIVIYTPVAIGHTPVVQGEGGVGVTSPIGTMSRGCDCSQDLLNFRPSKMALTMATLSFTL